MAGFLSDQVNNAFLDMLFGGTPFPVPSRIWFGLSKYPASKSGPVLEPAGGGYSRVSIANDTAAFPPAIEGRKDCTVQIRWPAPTARWGIIRAVFLADAPVGGRLLAIADIDRRLILPGPDGPSIEVGRFHFEHR